MKRLNKIPDQQGFGLVEVLIVAGLLAIIVAVMTDSVTLRFNLQRRWELDDDRQAFKDFVLKNYSCYGTGTTSPYSKCNQVGAFVDLKNALGDVLIPKTGVTIERWTYFAECRSPTGAINVRAVHVAPGVNLSAPGIDPSDGKYYVKDPLDPPNWPKITIYDDRSLLFRADNTVDETLCDKKQPPRIVPFYGSYPSTPNYVAPMTQEIGGKPIYVQILNPGNSGQPGFFPPSVKYYVQMDAIPSGQHVFMEGLPGAQFDIQINDFGFTVGGDLVKTSPPIGAYPDWVYFGYMDVAWPSK